MKLLIIVVTSDTAPTAGSPMALQFIRFKIPVITPNTSCTIARDKAAGTTGMDLSSCNVPATFSNSSLSLATLTAMRL